MDDNRRVFVAGHNGMVGRALVRKLVTMPGVSLVVKERTELDLCDRKSVQQFFEEESINEVYLAAAQVGGIHANNAFPALFIENNLNIQLSVIKSAHDAGINKLLFLGSSCIYPRMAEQPIIEESLLSGLLEPTNEPYAIAKIAGIKLCEAYNRQYGTDYRSIMPTNLYGPYDNFHPENSHVLPALIQRFHNAVEEGLTQIEIWGSGKAKREFLHVDDMAEACVHIMSLPKKEMFKEVSERCSHVNVGSGEDCTIEDLAKQIAKVTSYMGELEFDSSRPDGAPRKLLNVGKINRLGWQHSISLTDGLKETYEWYKNNINSVRKS